MLFDYPFGATPLNQDEIEALKPKHITTQEQLNEFEELNILVAKEWCRKKKIYNYTNTRSGFFEKSA